MGGMRPKPQSRYETKPQSMRLPWYFGTLSWYPTAVIGMRLHPRCLEPVSRYWRVPVLLLHAEWLRMVRFTAGASYGLQRSSRYCELTSEASCLFFFFKS